MCTRAPPTHLPVVVWLLYTLKTFVNNTMSLWFVFKGDNYHAFCRSGVWNCRKLRINSDTIKVINVKLRTTDWVFSCTDHFQFAKDLTGCWIHICMFIIHDGERRKPSTAWKVSNKLESSAFRGQTWVLRVLDCWLLFALCFFVVVVVVLFFSDDGGRSLSASGGHFQCLLLDHFCVLAMFTPDRKSFLTKLWSVCLWCCLFWLCQVHLLAALWWPEVFVKTKLLKWQAPGAWVLSRLFRHRRRVCKCHDTFHMHLCPFLHFSLLVQHDFFFGVWLMAFCS